MITKIKSFFSQGAERSIKAKKNIAYMLFLKGGSIVISLILVPLTLNYVDSATYGIWLALSSMVTWIHFLDIGINNGLKNKLAEAFANNDLISGKKYVSTTYAILTLIFVPVMVLLLLITPFLNWESILNLSEESAEGLIAVICILVVYFCLNFILSTINVVLQADQRPADAAFRQFIGQLLSLVIIYFLTLVTKGSLLNLCIGLSVAPLIITLIFNLTLFSGRYREISPSLSYVDFKVAPSLLKLGVMFFITQISFIITTQISNFLILRYYGAVEVTNYNIAERYFGAIGMVWQILVAPLWVAVTDAVSKGDNLWISNAIKKYLKYLMLFAFLFIVLLFIAQPVYNMWLGNKVVVPFILSFFMMLYKLSYMVTSLFVQVLNGAGILRIQTLLSFMAPVIFLVSFFAMYSLGLGVYSILIAMMLSNINGLIVAPIQCVQLFFKNRVKGSSFFLK